MKKDLDNKEIMKKIWQTVHSLKVIYEKAIDVNNELKVNVDEQYFAIKHLKEQCPKVKKSLDRSSLTQPNKHLKKNLRNSKDNPHNRFWPSGRILLVLNNNKKNLNT